MESVLRLMLTSYRSCCLAVLQTHADLWVLTGQSRESWEQGVSSSPAVTHELGKAFSSRSHSPPENDSGGLECDPQALAVILFPNTVF